MSNDGALTTRQGSIWIQPDGYGTTMKRLACRTLGDLSVTHGSRELIQCFDAEGNYVTQGSTKGAPEIITTSMEILLKRKPDWIERLTPTNDGYRCQFPLYVMERTCGRGDDATNFVRAVRLGRADIAVDNYSQLVSRNEDQEAMLNVDIEAEPPASVFHEILGRRQTIAETQKLNDVWFNTTRQCNPDCGLIYQPGDLGMAVAEPVALATANVYYTSNAGKTWTVVATDPFAAVDDGVMSVTCVEIGNSRVRWIVAVDASDVAAGQGVIAYIDAAIGSLPTGAWTSVSIGGAAAGHGAPYGGCLFSLDKDHIWLATAAGYIYFSEDAGITWTAQEAGTIHAGNYFCINFIDESYGVASGAADIIAVTTNGGDSWTAGTALGNGDDILCCAQLNRNWLWAGTDEGKMWYSHDRAVTWTQITNFTGSGVGNIQDMHWLDEGTGFIAHDNASPVGTIRYTIDGGANWKDVTTVTNAGLNAIFAVNNNLCYTVGNVVAAGTAFVGKQSLLFDELD